MSVPALLVYVETGLFRRRGDARHAFLLSDSSVVLAPRTFLSQLDVFLSYRAVHHLNKKEREMGT